jgi:transposase-like protein
MPRHYGSTEKRIVLERLIANGGDVARTARQTGISERTIHRWRKEAHLTLTALTPLPPIPPQNQPVSPQTGQPTSDTPDDPLAAFIPAMTAEANYLLGSIRDAIEDAPLHQRVVALVQLIDRIERLDARAQMRAARLNPFGEEEDVKIIHEYEVEGHVEKTDDLDEGFPESPYIPVWPRALDRLEESSDPDRPV